MANDVTQGSLAQRCSRFAAFAACAALTGIASAATQPAPQITFVHMGGNDCPPCVAWRGLELPKIQADPRFAGVRYVYVVKSVHSTVPSAMFFPEGAKDLQPVLAEAGNGRTGSPYQALLVNGRVVDYWFGTRKGQPEELLRAIEALQNGQPYPRKACTRLAPRKGCLSRKAGDTDE